MVAKRSARSQPYQARFCRVGEAARYNLVVTSTGTARPSGWKRFKRRCSHWLAVHLFGRILLPLLVRTWRREIEIPEDVLARTDQPEKLILSFWHNRQIGLLALAGRLGSAKVLVSRHGDGEIIAQIVARFGIETIRGSSTRGGIGAFRQLVTQTHSSHIMITPDGPVGPRYVVKKGVMMLASMTGRPIFWISFGVDRAWVFDSWDRFILPKPFARLRFRAGGPLRIEKHATPEQLAAGLMELQTEMRDQTALLDEQEGHPIDPALDV